ncbi:peptidoglycan-binding domain-containing protein [Actinoplanes sp. NPDC051470]|uniref:peptidoglycan-binding domain-containing protein n=1 Tax=unclassified Actinoplanes TaxID=2626549 RepID=UPI003419162C
MQRTLSVARADGSPGPGPIGAGPETHLSSPRFAADDLLEACYQDRGRLAIGMTNESVRKVQQALLDLAYDLGPAGADGVHGPMTVTAVKNFKKDESLGFAEYGDVGPGTMRRLDQLFSGRRQNPPDRRKRGGEFPRSTAKVEVLATHIGGIPGGVKHLFIVHTSDADNKTAYRAGPGVCPDGPRPDGAPSIMEDHGPYNDRFIDWDPNAPSVTAVRGQAANDKDACLLGHLRDIDAACIAYSPLGPNSNTVARTLLERCGIPQAKPDVVAPGWDATLPTKK